MLRRFRCWRTWPGPLLLAGLVGCGSGEPPEVASADPRPTPAVWAPGVRDERASCATYCELHGRSTLEGTIDLDCGTTFFAYVGPRSVLDGEDVFQRWAEQRPRAFPNSNAYGDYDYDEFFEARVLYCPECREADFLFGPRYEP